MTDPTHEDLVTLLIDARRGSRAVDAATWTGLLKSEDDAYAVQRRVAEELGWFADGSPLAWKSGGARDAVLTHAPLPPAGVRASPAHLADLHFSAPLVESEIALRIGWDVDADEAADLTHETAEALVDAMAVSIEVVDSRWTDLRSTHALLRLADSQVHGALVLGDWVPYVRGHDWAAQRCEARIGGKLIEKTGTHPLGQPAWLLPQWLRHATREGERVRKGTVVTTGTWTGMTPVGRGDSVVVTFPGIGRAELVV